MIKTSEISLLDDNFWTEYNKALGMSDELYQEATEKQKNCIHNDSLKFEPVGDQYYYTCVDCDMSFRAFWSKNLRKEVEYFIDREVRSRLNEK